MIEHGPTEGFANWAIILFSVQVREIPIGCRRCDNKLAYSNGHFAIPEKPKEVEAQTTLDPNIPVYACIRGSMALSNLPRTENKYRNCDPKGKENPYRNEHEHWNQDSLAFLLSEFCSRSDYHYSDLDFPNAT